MAIKDRRASRDAAGKNRRNKDREEYRGKMREIAKDSATTVKISMHNALISLIFAMAMLLLCVALTEISFAITGVVIGSVNQGAFETLADLIVVIVTAAMVCGFAMFFGFKIQNMLIKAMKARYWHKGEDGTIVKRAKSSDDK